jgi:acyl carrier protein
MTDEIRTILEDHAHLPVGIDELTDESDLFQAGMTSHASLSVMLALEDGFGIEFPDRMLKRNIFSSIGSIRDALVELGAPVA